MTVNVDVLWDNQNKRNLACLLSKCFLLRYVKPSAYLQCFLDPTFYCGTMMPCGIIEVSTGMPFELDSHFFLFFTATISVLFFLLYGNLFPSFILTSFFFLFLPFLVSPVSAHQQLGFKMNRVSFRSVNWPVAWCQTQSWQIDLRTTNISFSFKVSIYSFMKFIFKALILTCFLKYLF